MHRYVTSGIQCFSDFGARGRHKELFADGAPSENVMQLKRQTMEFMTSFLKQNNMSIEEGGYWEGLEGLFVEQGSCGQLHPHPPVGVAALPLADFNGWA